MFCPGVLPRPAVHNGPRPPAPRLPQLAHGLAQGGEDLRRGGTRYRSKLRIIADILAVINEEGGSAGPTRILYGANLSHERMVRYLAEMEEKGLVKRVELEEGRVR
ncbi:MAG TPA: hypothetical protein ENG43_00675, partial [Candidatus Bathyarchaeota archaeon]|nr:hypothetical protein [Candidatus Bathyarchaeota archaeon]HEW89841.1 hypothetical protein [Candidatus Bathyarchaeota archaeon]